MTWPELDQEEIQWYQISRGLDQMISQLRIGGLDLDALHLEVISDRLRDRIGFPPSIEK